MQGNFGGDSHKLYASGLDLRFAYDFDGVIGDPVVAMREGRVLTVRDGVPGPIKDPWPGNHIVIDHLDGTVALYAHLRCGTGSDDRCSPGAITVIEGMTVLRGQHIAQVGNTGTVLVTATGDGSHVHVQTMLLSEFNLLGFNAPSRPFAFIDPDTARHHGVPQSSEYYVSSNALIHGGPISFPDFQSITGLQLVNGAAQVGNALRVAPAAFFVRGAAWFTGKVSVQDGFETTFQFRLTDQDLGLGGADGFAFVIQNDTVAAIGGFGQHLGYGTDVTMGIPGIPNSLAVEFDTFFNVNDPNGNHINVQTNGILPNNADHGSSLGDTGTSLAVNLKDGNVHAARIQYLPGTMSVYIDNPAVPVLSVPLNLARILNLPDGKAYVGFTAATAAGFQNHDILSWSFID